MARSRDDAEGGPRQEPDPRPTEVAPDDVTIVLTAIDARLEQLERFTTGIDHRLQVIETRLQAAAPSLATAIARPAVSLPQPVEALPVASPIPVPAVHPVAGEPEALPVATPGLLERELVPHRPDGGPASQPDQRPPVASPKPPAQPKRRPALSLDDLERAVSGRGLAWAGGLTLLLGALFFLGLAISRGWIGPETRVAIALVSGIVVTVLGDRLMRGGDRILGPVLVAVGIGIWNLGLVAGTRLYDFIPLLTALLGAAAGAAVATAIAVRANAQVIALYGIVTALAAPLLFAVPGERAPIAYLVIVLAGSTAIAIARGWSWLPPVAFVLSEVQLYLWWFSADPPMQALIVAISGLTLLHLVAAAGIERWARTRGPRAVAGMLLIFNAISYTVTVAGALSDNRTALAGLLLAGFAAHAALGWLAMERSRRATSFVHVAFGIAVVLFTLAVPAYFRGQWIAIVWGAEAVGLIWLTNRSRIVAGYMAAVIVFGLAVWQFFAAIYGDARPRTGARLDEGVPFVNGEGLTLLALLAMLAVTGRMLPAQWARVTVAVIGIGLLIAALPAELSGLPLLAGWGLLAVLALAVERLLAQVPGTASPDRQRASWAANGLKLLAVVAAVLAIERAVAFEMPVLTPVPFEAGAPYLGQPVAATVIIVLAALAAVAVSTSNGVRQVAGSVAILITAHLAAFELDPALAVAVWSGFAVGAAALQLRTPGTLRVYLGTAGLLLATGLVVTIVAIAPPARLLVSGPAAIDHPFLWSGATLALGALSVALFAVGWSIRGMTAGTWLQLGSGVLALYLVSVGIVDEFQGRVSGAATVAELRRQSQVALSIVWAVLGGLGVAVGLIRALPALRWFGLGLLTLATGKVFLYDLASLDAVYRVLSFMVLGVLLLLSSYAYRRLGAQPAPVETAPDVAGASADATPG